MNIAIDLDYAIGLQSQNTNNEQEESLQLHQTSSNNSK